MTEHRLSHAPGRDHSLRGRGLTPTLRRVPRPRTRWQAFGFVLGLALCGALLLLDTGLRREGGGGAAAAAAVTALMASWWVFEALPIHVTALVPLVAFPLLGVAPGDLGARAAAAALPYVDPYIFLFLGGMGIAAAMQQWGLHRRIALTIMAAIGTQPRRLLLGVLLATAFVSLWISNTATAAMMVPIALAVVRQLEARQGGRRLACFGAAVMLAVAYGANAGGIGTKIGTAPNMQLTGFLAQTLGLEVSFLAFAGVGLGFVALLLPVVWLALWRVGRADAPRAHLGRDALRAERAQLGGIRRGEKVVAAVFLATAAAWVAGKPLTEALAPLVRAFQLRSAHVEGGVAMAAAAVLLVARVEGRAVLGLHSLRLIPWSTLLLLGGGFSMAAAVEQSGLSAWMGTRMAGLRDLAPFLQVLVASVATVTLSAFASNTATIAVMLPVLLGTVAREHATTVLFAATIASSCDFALPAGTPPNAIVFGTGYVTVPRMAKTGAVLDLIAAVLAACWCALVVPVVIGAPAGG